VLQFERDRRHDSSFRTPSGPVPGARSRWRDRHDDSLPIRRSCGEDAAAIAGDDRPSRRDAARPDRAQPRPRSPSRLALGTGAIIGLLCFGSVVDPTNAPTVLAPRRRSDSRSRPGRPPWLPGYRPPPPHSVAGGAGRDRRSLPRSGSAISCCSNHRTCRPLFCPIRGALPIFALLAAAVARRVLHDGNGSLYALAPHPCMSVPAPSSHAMRCRFPDDPADAAGMPGVGYYTAAVRIAAIRVLSQSAASTAMSSGYVALLCLRRRAAAAAKPTAWHLPPALVSGTACRDFAQAVNVSLRRAVHPLRPRCVCVRARRLRRGGGGIAESLRRGRQADGRLR